MPFVIPPKEDWRRAVSSAYKIDQAKFTDWTSHLQSNLTHFSTVSHLYTPWKRQKTREYWNVTLDQNGLMEEISPKPEALNTFINNSC